MEEIIFPEQLRLKVEKRTFWSFSFLYHMTRISQTVDFFFLVLLTFFIVFNLLARNWLANNSEVGVCKKQKYKSRWGDESFFFVGVGWLTSSLFSSSVSTFIYMVKIVALILESGSVLEIIALDFSWRKKYTALSVSVSENKIYPPPPPSRLLHLC